MSNYQSIEVFQLLFKMSTKYPDMHSALNSEFSDSLADCGEKLFKIKQFELLGVVPCTAVSTAMGGAGMADATAIETAFTISVAVIGAVPVDAVVVPAWG